MTLKQFLVLVISVSVISVANLSAQTAADSISVVFPKVLAVKNKKEVLLYYDARRLAYEVPSIGTLDGPVSYKAYVDSAAKDIGITYKNLRLGGIFTYIYPNEYSTYIRPYFVIQYTGQLDANQIIDSSYKWVPIKEAIELIPYPASSMIVEHILEHPRVVWGATFEEYGYTNPVDTSKIKFRIIENFFQLN